MARKISRISINRIYKYIDLNDGGLRLLEELRDMADSEGLFNLNAAIKEDIAERYQTQRLWVSATLRKLISLGFVTDLGMGRYEIDLYGDLLMLIDSIKNNEVDEIVFEVTLKPKENTKSFRLISFQ